MNRLLLSLSLFALASSASGQTDAPRSYEGLALPFREVEVSSPVQGQVAELVAREGDETSSGELLASLFSRIEELQMERAKSAMEKREFDYRGAQNLFSDRLISEDEALTRRIELDLARLDYEIAREQFELRRIKAPISGIVVERLVEIGEMVTANQPVYVVVDIDRLYVQFYARAEDLSLLRVGARAEARFPEWGAEEIFAGAIDFVDPRVDAASGLMRVRVLLDNPERVLKAGLRAEVTVTLQP